MVYFIIIIKIFMLGIFSQGGHFYLDLQNMQATIQTCFFND
jgi:hypothetical protein